MATAFPATVEHRLDQALGQYRQWCTDTPLEGPPRVVSPLTGGHSNHAFLVEADAQFVVRIDGIDPDLHGLNRQAEWRVLQAAGDAQLAPMPRYFNPELGALVVDYLAPDVCDTFDSPGIAGLLRAIHALPPRHNRVDLGERLRRYLHRIRSQGTALPALMTTLESQLPALLEQLEALAGPAVLCHNDLLPPNRLRHGGRWWALDWEYAAMGNRWFDVAVVVWGDGLQGDERERLVVDYLGRHPHQQEQRQLTILVALYGFLECSWYLAAGDSIDDAQLHRLQKAFEHA
jgi:thiamine kinase-like enzyme